MALHHVVVGNRELHDEETQGHRGPPKVELIVVESLLGVALSKIKLILCYAVGDDRGDDGDVHHIDDDDAIWRRGEEGTVPSRAVSE